MPIFPVISMGLVLHGAVKAVSSQAWLPFISSLAVAEIGQLFKPSPIDDGDE